MSSGPELCQLVLASGGEVEAAVNDVVPVLTHSQVVQLADSFGLTPDDLERRIKRLAFLTSANPSQERLAASNTFARKLATEAMPITDGPISISLNPTPAELRPPWFDLADDLREVEVAFDRIDRSKRSRNVFDGLVRFGVFSKATSPTRLLVVTTPERASAVESLVERLNRGSQRYLGARKTFGSDFVTQERLICKSVDDYQEELRTFAYSPKRHLVDVALVYLPKIGDTSDPGHPYFRTKGFLLREGLASQMVDETTVAKPDWRDLNLGLNIHAKSGRSPWVLDEPIEGVDLFIGLSSSQMKRNGRIIRMMGYVNIFDSYGRWRFYHGGSSAFAFEDRLRHYDELIRNSVAAYKGESGRDIKSIEIHLTKRFSNIERDVIARAVHAVCPEASIVYVWINPHHSLRMFNIDGGSKGKISRATLLSDESAGAEPDRGYIATTGRNSFGQSGMGTPVPLEITIWNEPRDARVSVRDVAQHILSLTRLNWSSSRSFSREPVTTKYARDIAKIMSALMEDEAFSVNASLRGTPWFL